MHDFLALTHSIFGIFNLFDGFEIYSSRRFFWDTYGELLKKFIFKKKKYFGQLEFNILNFLNFNPFSWCQKNFKLSIHTLQWINGYNNNMSACLSVSLSVGRSVGLSVCRSVCLKKNLPPITLAQSYFHKKFSTEWPILYLLDYKVALMSF